jgi:hypothetical protein
MVVPKLVWSHSPEIWIIIIKRIERYESFVDFQTNTGIQLSLVKFAGVCFEFE